MTSLYPDVPPAIKTVPSGSKVAVCQTRGTFMWPVGVKVPGACAIAVGAWLANANKRSGRTKSTLSDARNFLPVGCMSRLLIWNHFPARTTRPIFCQADRLLDFIVRPPVRISGTRFNLRLQCPATAILFQSGEEMRAHLNVVESR